MKLDLHMHSTASDGIVSPTEVVERAIRGRLDAIALTDHDTVAGVGEARMAAEGHPLEVIPGIEVSCTWEGGEIHVLGYFVDPENPALVAHGGRARNQREARLRGMVGRLAEQGIHVPFDAVLEAAGDEVHTLGRPHLARAMVATGAVADVHEAFDHYIGNEHPAYLPTHLLSPEEGVALIRSAGGVAVWAHPPVEQLDALLPRLVRSGLGGVEVYRPRNSPDRVRLLERTARTAGLLRSGGSDWHGPDDGELGDFHVEAGEVAELLSLGGM